MKPIRFGYALEKEQLIIFTPDYLDLVVHLTPDEVNSSLVCCGNLMTAVLRGIAVSSVKPV